ncbi:MAG: tetratricopeptide repeat protein [candidate division WOR-3 bacterium]
MPATTLYALSELELTNIYLGTYFNLGIAYGRLNKPREAIKYFQKFIEIATPEHTDKVIQVQKVILELEKILKFQGE